MSTTPPFTMPAAMSRSLLRTLDQLDLKLAAARPDKGTLRSPSAWLRRLGATLAGIGLIAAGVPMLVLPGPGVLAILVGLSVLAGQFGWARRLLVRITNWARRTLAAIPASGAPA